jgi:[protein-PII] uridylyltransferase
MPRRYFLSHTPRQIARHARVVVRYGEGRKLATAHRNTEDGFSEFILCTRDVHGLYSQVAGVMTACGLNILGSHVYTTRRGPRARDLRDADASRGRERAGDALAGGSNPSSSSCSRGPSRSAIWCAGAAAPVGTTRPPSRKPPRVLISNTESEFYTLVDVIADDRIGLLYDVTRTLGEHGAAIYISKAATIKDQVTDAFYVKDAEGKKIKDPVRPGATS